MVARKNVKPELGDSIRKLVNKTTAGNTVPYGVKAVEVDEGTNYYTPDGGSVYLDGLKLSQWDAQISGAEQALVDAQLAIDESTAALATTETRLDTMDQDIIEIRGGDIDVPGTLAAKVVQAMDIEAKRLVVTEDAILNQVTVIEGIVTPELVSQNIVLTDLGYDLMQSASLVVTGPTGTVELSGSGYRAWNAQNEQTVRLDGSDNVVVGTFRTAFDGARVRMTKVSDQALIELYADSSLNRSVVWQSTGGRLNLYSQLDSTQSINTITDTGISIDSGTDTIYFAGKVGNTRAFQKGQVNWTSFAAGQYMTFQTVTFPTAFSSVPHITCQAQTENSTDIVITLRSRSTTGFTYNIVNQSSGNSTGALRMDWIAIG